MSELYKRIRSRRERLGMTQDELAGKLNYKSRSSINKIEMGQNDIPQSKIQAFADALYTTPAYLMGWTDMPDRPKNTRYPSLHREDPEKEDALKQESSFRNKLLVEEGETVLFPVMKDIAGIVQGNLIEVLSGETQRISWHTCLGDPNDYLLWKVKGDDMSPGFLKDDHLLVQRGDMPEVGDIVLIYAEGQGALLRKMTADPAGHIILQPLNPKYSLYTILEKNPMLHILGKVVLLERQMTMPKK